MSSDALSNEDCQAIVGVITDRGEDHIAVNYTGAFRNGNVEGTGIYLAKMFNSLNAAKEYVAAGWKAAGTNIATTVNETTEGRMGRVCSGKFADVEDFLLSIPWKDKSFKADVAYLYTDDGWVVASKDMAGAFRVNTTLNRVYEMHVRQLNDEIFRAKDISNTYLRRLQSI